MAVPTRSTNEITLDQFNIAMRSTPWYQQFLTSIGQNRPGIPARLSRDQQSQLERLMAQNGFRVPDGMHVDQGGNLNQRNRTARNIAIGAAIGGATLATMGAAGAFSGAAAGGAGAGAGAGGAGAAGAAGAGAGAAGAGAGAAGGTLGAATLAGGGLPWVPHAAGLASAGIGSGAAAGAGAGLGTAAAGAGGSSLMNRLRPYLQTGSALAGTIGQNMSQNRGDENNAARDANNAAQRQYETQQDALLRALGLQDNAAMQRGLLDVQQRQHQQQQRQFALDAPSTRGRQALFGSMMANLQPVSMSGLPSRISRSMPTISGGLSPSAINPDARAMGSLMARLALENQQRGDSVDTFTPPPSTNFMGGILPPPNMQGYRGPGTGESIMGMLGLIDPALQYFSGARANQANPAFGTRG